MADDLDLAGLACDIQSRSHAADAASGDVDALQVRVTVAVFQRVFECLVLTVLIFLDIYMDQDNGMDVAVRIREAGDSCSLIFVTSSDAFAVASYDVQAAYYLLKPLDTAKLMKVLDTIQIKNAQDVRYIEVICDRTPVRVPVKTILYADTFHNAVQLHTDAGVLRTYLTFQKFEELIQDLPCFLSCYRGCLVNMDRIHKTLEDSFLLDNQEVVQIRKRGANAIKKEYLNYLFS